MRLACLIALTMVAFAANSILNRLAISGGDATPAAFAAIRVLSGAVILCTLAGRDVWSGLFQRARLAPALSLTLYLLGFSFAYLSLDAGVGALILFAGVQITMFAGALLAGDRPVALRWIGMGIGIVGLVWLLLPGETVQIPMLGTLLMAAAAIGWGIYSLIGRGSKAPLADTAAAFVLSVPIVVLAWLVSGEGAALTPAGIGLAVLSGAVTSGLGYALWYSVLPQVDATVAALSQLTVPVIALAAGVVLLGEIVDLRAALAAALVLGGVAIGLLGASAGSAPKGRK